MYYKEDWEIVKKRYEALWAGEILDRCCVAVTAPRKGCEHFFDPKEHKGSYNMGAMLASQYMNDPYTAMREKEKILENTYFAGDAIPQLWFNYGSVGHAAYFDAPYYVGKETTWFDPVIFDWDEQELKFNPDNQILQWQLEAARIYAEEAKGKYFISTPDNSGCLDALSALRPTEDLLVDMLTEPELVKRELKKIIDAWKNVGDQLHALTKDCNDGGATIGWLSIWAPGRFSQLQADISVMLSNEMFKEFIVPELIETANHQEYNLYHLDGIGQLRHLDDILAIPNIHMIQWVSVVGEPSYMENIESLKKIQKAGKGLLINDVEPNHIESLLSELSPKGLLLMTSASSQEMADDIVKKVEKWTVK